MTTKTIAEQYAARWDEAVDSGWIEWLAEKSGKPFDNALAISHEAFAAGYEHGFWDGRE